MRLLLLLAACLAVSASAAGVPKSFAGHRVYRVQVEGREQAEKLDKLRATYDFWTELRVNGPVDIMVAGAAQPAFEAEMVRMGLAHTTMIADVQALIQAEAAAMAELQAKKVPNPKHNMDWDSYHPLEDMYGYFDYLTGINSDVSVESIGESYLGQDMKIIKICRGGCGNKPAMWIDGGIHAREWISPAAVMFMVRELTENLDGSGNDDLVENLDWYFLPVLNPDGYDYTRNEDRMWRKTRSDFGNECVGTDANRNFGYEWNTGGSSDNSCAQDYHGPSAFSEVETQNVADFLTGVKDQVKFYNNVHSYSQLVLLPWGFNTDIPPYRDDVEALMTSANEALYATHGKVYDVGCIPCMLYVASGGSLDWTLGELDIKYSIGMELRDTGVYGFLLPPEQIVPTGEEVWAFHQVVARGIIAEFVPQEQL